MSLDGPRQRPADGRAARKLVIFAHGYGSNGADLISLAPYLAQTLTEAAFVSPNAPEPVPGYPGGYQWFPLALDFDPAAIAAGARRAAPVLDAFIDAELERCGLQAADCALVGFSQGAMMALHVGLRRAEPLAGVVALSGLLAAPETLPGEIRSRPPVFLAHGDMDEVVPARALPAAAAALGACGVPVAWRISPGGGHGIGPDVIALAARFLRERFTAAAPPWQGPQSP